MPSESRWKEICDGIDTASKMIIFATDASNVKPEDFVTYFRRMNKSGVVPSDEDIMYSMIKANVNDLKRLDNYSGGLTSPARLAYIVLRYSLDNKWIEKVTIEDVKKLNKEQYTRITEVVNKITEIKEKINKNTSELLPYHRVRFANFSNGDIYLLLMKLVEKDVSEVNLSGLATLILWFSINPSQTVKTIWEATVKSEKHFNVKCISEGVWKAASQGFLLPPPKLNDVKEIKNMAENLPKQYDCCFDACSDLVNFIESAERFPQLDKVWNGFYGKDGGRDLLLFACKEYIKDVFGGYDLSKPEWKEQNRPWDYDHILPKSWYHGTKYWGITNEKPFYALCDKMLWSIGNSCPLPFSQNRSNSNDGPEENYPNTTGDKDSENVHVNKEVLSKYKLLKNKYIDEKDGENYDVALNFIIGTAKRMHKLSSKWFINCKIGELLKDASSCLQIEKKPSLLLYIRQSLKEKYPKCEIKCVYVARDNRQYEIDVNEPIDWAKGLYGWQSCGIECTLKESNEKCFLAVTTYGKDVEIGIRRHPELTQIQGTNDWYWPNRYHSFRFDDKEHKCKEVQEIADECLKYFEDYLQYINI